MIFHSILCEKTTSRIKKETDEVPEFFGDLNLDQIIAAITASKQEYNLAPFFYTPLHDIETIAYRHDIFRDLENPALFEYITAYAQKMRAMREQLVQAGKLHYSYQKKRCFLEAVDIYCDAILALVHNLSLVELHSPGFKAFRDYVTYYADSERFTSLLAETKKLKTDFSEITYCLLIKGSTVRVRQYAGEINYSTDVEATFEKFKQGAVKDYTVKLSDWMDMNHVEAKILDQVALLYPDIFTYFTNYCAQNSHYLDETMRMFDREIQFYLAYLEYVALFKRAGLSFCYPRISDTVKDVAEECDVVVAVAESFDAALAYNLIRKNTPVICNDFSLTGKERIIVVTGPNQGGKTTFARTFGQLHYLASLGCPVPGKRAQLFLFDRLFTHFEQEEDIKNLRGKLQDDLVRFHDILNQASSSSVIIMNEIFNSTTLQDAIFLSKEMMSKIVRLDALGVCVTFIDELASFSEKTVSMVSTVVPDNPALRTFKIIRKPADGLAYAISIAEKYGLTYEALQERIQL
ncbi:DNA mismatch repair protein MutS domain protein [Candidatus Vecturithrix granuli]|uniref:DNA mismatch repair protein MutS domain protein n=1 Tax=Vecturithrix granuli TaxID=1499967 RepID=A0A081C6M2_VECG1|nr:DNA mismatch repair protein MutS domain protein [Candidatus Vecturithrix granuli]